MYGFEAMWPAGRTELDGRSMGDVWEHSALPDDGSGWSNLVPFHKLSQWMTYSLMEPLQVGVMGGLGDYNRAVCGCGSTVEYSGVMFPLLLENEYRTGE